VSRACKGCSSEHVGLLDDLIRAGLPGADILRRMADVGVGLNHSNLNTHRKHVEEPETEEELQRLVRELEHEAAMSPATVALLYRELIRGAKAMTHRKPPSPAEMVRLATAIKEITGISYKQQMLGAFLDSAFKPRGALASRPEVPAALLLDEE